MLAKSATIKAQAPVATRALTSPPEDPTPEGTANPGVAPAGRLGPAMAWDGNTQRVILFGGYEFGASGLTKSDYWLWNGQLLTTDVLSGPAWRLVPRARL